MLSAGGFATVGSGSVINGLNGSFFDLKLKDFEGFTCTFGVEIGFEQLQRALY